MAFEREEALSGGEIPDDDCAILRGRCHPSSVCWADIDGVHRFEHREGGLRRRAIMIGGARHSGRGSTGGGDRKAEVIPFADRVGRGRRREGDDALDAGVGEVGRAAARRHGPAPARRQRGPRQVAELGAQVAGQLRAAGAH